MSNFQLEFKLSSAGAKMVNTLRQQSRVMCLEMKLPIPPSFSKVARAGDIEKCPAELAMQMQALAEGEYIFQEDSVEIAKNSSTIL